MYIVVTLLFLENYTQYDEQNYTLEILRIIRSSPCRTRKNYRYNNEGKRFRTNYCSFSHATGLIFYYLKIKSFYRNKITFR